MAMAIVMLAIFVTIYETFAMKICMILTWPLELARDIVNMSTDSYMKAIVMFDISVTIYEMFAMERCVALTLNVRLEQG